MHCLSRMSRVGCSSDSLEAWSTWSMVCNFSEETSHPRSTSWSHRPHNCAKWPSIIHYLSTPSTHTSGTRVSANLIAPMALHRQQPCWRCTKDFLSCCSSGSSCPLWPAFLHHPPIHSIGRPWELEDYATAWKFQRSFLLAPQRLTWRDCWASWAPPRSLSAHSNVALF